MPGNDDLSRRQFVGGALLAGAGATWFKAAPAAAAESAAQQPKGFSRRIKLGLIGCGGRARWLGGLFQKHGGYEIHGVADYFDDLAQSAGDLLGVDKARRFSGRSGYRRLLESGVEAVAVVNVPRFHAEHGPAAIEAGCHVFAAKPVAIDVPGALKVQAAGKLATQKKLCYLVDYQMPTDPVNIEVVKRVRAGALGRLMHIDSIGFSLPWAEPAGVKTIEDRLRQGRWLSTIALSGDVITENTIHSINAVLWLVGQRPVRAVGRARVGRPNPRDDYREVYLVTYEFADGLLWTHRCQSLNNQLEWDLYLIAYGDRATARVGYKGRSYVRGGPMHYGGGNVESLYDQGAIRNIATFYTNIVEGRFDNPTAQQAGDDALTAVLGREAAARRREVTLEELLRENKELEIDLSGLRG
ncbi:MAG: Gfo/Idh/MocA family oxidoreductase [Thermoguttaceae bacterium]|jgi:predicted dehydrogenase|nr:Gfo/Idh/MocA family oxidoreductase [Thermoguttaceae bacterium]